MATSTPSGISSEDFCHCTDGDLLSKRSNPLARFFDTHDDAALAKEMNELSFEERNRVLEDIHGVADLQEESAELIQQCIKDMDNCLSKIAYSKRRDLERAIFLKPSLRNDQAFKLMFLRAENYNPRLAAERMVRYFAFKRDLFGEEKLAKKITWSDLNETDIRVGESGGVPLLLSQPDRTGRPVLFMDVTRSSFDNMRNVLRYNIHQVMALISKDEAAQKKGYVILMFCPNTEFISGRFPAPSEVFNSFREGSALTRNLPIRTTSMHFCYDHPVAKFFISIIRAGLGKDIRLRLRPHFGSAMEMKYSLLTFGIHTDGIILSGDRDEEDEKPKLFQAHVEHWLELERIEQKRLAAEQSTGILTFPTPNDILIGRGRPYQEFSGNQRFIEMVSSEVERYRDCKHSFEKTRVVMDVIKKIRESGGNFVRRREDGWEIVNEEATIDKVRKAFQAKPAGGGGMPASCDDKPVSSRSAKRLKVDPGITVSGAEST